MTPITAITRPNTRHEFSPIRSCLTNVVLSISRLFTRIIDKLFSSRNDPDTIELMPMRLQNLRKKKRMNLKEALALVPGYKVRKYSAEEVEVARIRDIYVGKLARILTSPWKLQSTKQEALIALKQLNLTDQEHWNMLQRYSLSSFL